MIRLVATFDAVQKIADRLSTSLEREARRFPVSAEDMDPSDDLDALRMEGFLLRYQQMTDHMLRKLFPRYWSVLNDTADFLPLRDLLDGLHRIDLVDNPADWMAISELRNRLAHDYALDAAERARDMNLVWEKAPKLLEQFANMREHAIARQVIVE